MNRSRLVSSVSILFCKKELNLMLKVSETSSQGVVGFELLYDLNNKG